MKINSDIKDGVLVGFGITSIIVAGFLFIYLVIWAAAYLEIAKYNAEQWVKSSTGKEVCVIDCE